MRRIAASLLTVALAGCAGLPATIDGATGTRIARASLATDAGMVETTWFLPEREATALIVLAPGFMRRCANLRETAVQLVAAGPMVVCIDAPMTGGNPALADALAKPVAAGLLTPDGRVAPTRLILAGHSAGAAFALNLGARLARQVPARVAGVLLFDPVATPEFAAALNAVADGGRRPVLAMFAVPHRCNARLSAAPAMHQLRLAATGAFVGVHLGPDTTHIDVEGDDTDWLAVAACGRPLPAQVRALRALAAQWAHDLANGNPPSRRWPEGGRPID